MARMLTDLPAAVRASGLKVILVPGWKTRGRPGAFNPRGVLVHHTGSTAGGYGVANGILKNGRPGLPGPLCQIGLGRAGEVYIVAAGRSNHAGRARSSGFMRAGDGNTQSIGIEAFLSGFEPWPGPMESAYHRLCAALCDHYGWPRSHVRSHAETSLTSKWDPGINGKHINMTMFRRNVAAVNLTGDKPMTEKEMQRLAQMTAMEILTYKNTGLEGDRDVYALLRQAARTWSYKRRGDKRDASQILVDIEARVKRLEENR